jgi:hypothetical protein
VRIEIDPAADAAAIEWAPRVRGQAQVVGRPGARGVRLYFDAAGDVVGLEVLGWSHRAETPQEVRVVVHAERAGEALPGAHPLVRALSTAPAVATDDRHRPLHEGRPMLTLAEAASQLGRERSWVSREMTSGRLRALKIGRTWWTVPEWVGEYDRARGQKPETALAAGKPRRLRRPPTDRRPANHRPRAAPRAT